MKQIEEAGALDETSGAVDVLLLRDAAFRLFLLELELKELGRVDCGRPMLRVIAIL